MSDKHVTHGGYYVPEYSRLPFFTALSLFLLGYGSLNLFEPGISGKFFFFLGCLVLTAVLYAWFRETIRENFAGLHNAQMNRSYRWGMFWFLFSDLMLFVIFLIGLLYARYVTVADLGGVEGYESSTLTNLLLWPNFSAVWPLLNNPNPVAFPGPRGTLDAWGIPAFNTLVLLASAFTMTLAQWELKHDKRGLVIISLILTIILGLLFLALQSLSFFLMNKMFALTLHSGIYASSLFMLMGLHAAHVIVGIVMLGIILIRVMRGHFTAEDHFGFEATSWYWQYIDAVWLLLFIMLYWL